MAASVFKDQKVIAFIQALLDENITYESMYDHYLERFGDKIALSTFKYKIKMSLQKGVLVRKSMPDHKRRKDGEAEEISYRDQKFYNLTSSRITNEAEFREWLWERLDKDKWEIDKLQIGYFEGQQKEEIEDDSGKKKTNAIVIPMYTFRAVVKPKANLFDPERFFRKLADEVPQIKVIAPQKSAKRVNRELLLEPFITDHHLGNVIHGEDYSVLYDLNTAEKYYDRIIDEILGRVDPGKIEEIWLPTGNDLIHADNNSLTTTRGTQLFGENYEKAVIVAEVMLIRNIEKLKLTGAKVVVIMVRGNHDWNSIFHLGRSLVWRYRDDPKVEIVTSRKHRIYRRFHKVGIGFSHGHYEDVKNLDRDFANEAPKIWADTKTRQFHIGDKHHFKQTKDWIRVEENLRMKGVDIIRGSTVCLPDQWHEDRSYIGNNNRSQYLIFNDEDHIETGYVVM